MEKKRFRQRGSLVLIVLALLSVGLLSTEKVWSEHGGNLSEAVGIKYLCVGRIAVRLGPREGTHDAEKRPLTPFADAEQNCRPPMLPAQKGSETLAAAVAPVSGYGAVLERLDAGPDDALLISMELLEEAGWTETAGSKLLRERRPDLAAAAYLKKGAWVVTLVVPRPTSSGTLMLTAGVWPYLKEEM